MTNELTYFPVTANFGDTIGGSFETFDVTIVAQARVPAGFTALIADLDLGGGNAGSTALAFPPQVISTNKGALSTSLLSNSAVVSEALAAAGISQLWYDIQFTKITLGYQIQNFSILAPTDTTAICLTDPGLTRYQYGGSVPVVSLPPGISTFGASLVSAANEAAAQALLGIIGSPVGYLGAVSSQSAMTALTASLGDFCLRTDLGELFYLTAAPASSASNWSAPASVVNNADGTLSVTGINALEPLSTTTILTANTPPVIGQTTYYNATSGNLTPTLPPLSALRVGSRLAVRRDPADVSSNTVTLSCAGSDTFYSSGTTSATLPLSGEQREYQVISVSGTKYWAPQGSLTPVSKLVPWSGGTAGILPATSGQHLTTAGGNTLDDGSGNATVAGSLTIGLHPIVLGEMSSGPSLVTGKGQLYIDSSAALHYASPFLDSKLMDSVGNVFANCIETTGRSTNMASSPVPWINANISPFGTNSTSSNVYLNNIAISDGTNYTGSGFQVGLGVRDSTTSTAFGPRIAIQGQVNWAATAGSMSQAQAQGVGLYGNAACAVNMGGTALTQTASVGQHWGGWLQSTLLSGATNQFLVTGLEIDVTALSGSSVVNKVGMGINLGGGDAVKGTLLDVALEFAKQSGATTNWTNGIMFGTNLGLGNASPSTSPSWPFASTSTMIGTSTPGSSDPTNPFPANIGIDFSQVTFTGPAIKLPAASIALAEMASAPSAITGDGQMYVASDGSLHYLSPGGTDTQLAPA